MEEDHSAVEHLFRELFHGRFTGQQANAILRQYGWDATAAVNFVLNSEPREVSTVAGVAENGPWIQVVNIRRNQPNPLDVAAEIRQFSCQNCDHTWWTKVPIRKRVSKCYRCRQRYKAIPRDREWGWAKYICGMCNNKFFGFGQMQSTPAPCLRCFDINWPIEILPPRRRNRRIRKIRNIHTCCAPNCYNRFEAVAALPDIHPYPVLCVHPRSIHRRAVYPSSAHQSSGSTVTTFLSQEDLAREYDGVLSDIEENNSSDSH